MDPCSYLVVIVVVFDGFFCFRVCVCVECKTQYFINLQETPVYALHVKNNPSHFAEREKTKLKTGISVDFYVI